MKELKDKDFDELFRSRITEEMPAFEEESWSKMEEKLRKKDRLLFYRYASIIVLLLSFGLAFYFINKTQTSIKEETATEQIEKIKSIDRNLKRSEPSTPAVVEPQQKNSALANHQSRQQRNEVRPFMITQKSQDVIYPGQQEINRVKPNPLTNIASVSNSPAIVNTESPVQKESIPSQQTAVVQQTTSVVPTEVPVKNDTKGEN
jgi:hypothetical protein